MICPNISDPFFKSEIERLGITQFYQNWADGVYSNKNLNSEINEVNKFNEALKEGFLKDFNVTVQEYDSIKKALNLNSTQAVSLIEKFIALEKGAKLDKSVAYLAYSLLGKSNSKIKSELKYNIRSWEKYNEKFEKYKNEIHNEKGFVKDKQKWKQLIRDKIIIDYLGETIVKYYNNPQKFEKIESKKWSKEDFTFIKKLYRAIMNLLGLNKPNNNKLKNISNSIAHEILTQEYDIFNYELSEEQVLRNYEDSINSDKKAKEIVEFSQNQGIVLTGSLALRKAGTVYRTSNETLHDLDFVVPYNKTDFSKETINDAINEYKFLGLDQKDGVQISQFLYKKFIENSEWFKQFKQKYPSYKLINQFVGSEHIQDFSSVTLTGIIDGEYNNGVYIEGTGYIIDHFVRLDTKKEEHENYFKLWKEIMIAKLMMGRAKDLVDFKAFVPFIKSKDSYNFYYPEYIYTNNDIVNKNTDEYGNTWNEIIIEPIRDISTIPLSVKAKKRSQPLIDSKYDQKGKLQDTLNRLKGEEVKDGVKIASVQNRIDRLTREIEDLIEYDEIDNIIAMAQADLSYVTDILTADTFDENEIDLVNQIVSFWTNSDIINDPDFAIISPIYLGMEELEGKSNPYKNLLAIINQFQLKEKFLDVIDSQLIAKDSKTSFGADVMIKDFSKKQDGFTANVYSLDAFMNPVMSFIGSKKFSAEVEAEMLAKEKEKEFFDLYNAAIESVGLEEFNKIFFREEGNTVNLENKLSQKYYSLYNNIWDKSIKDRNEWIRKNTIVADVRKLFPELNDVGGQVFDNAEIEAHKAELLENLGEKGYADLIESLTKKVNDYVNMREQAYEQAKDLSGEDEFNYVTKFMIRNSPFRYANELEGYEEIAGEKVYRNGRVYTRLVPRKVIDGKNTEYYSENFATIEANDKLYNLYKFIDSFNREARKILPYYLKKNIRVNTLANVRKSFLEQYRDADYKTITSQAWKSFVDSMYVSKEIGEENDKIQVRMIDALDKDNKSTDLSKVMPLFFREVYNYKMKSKVEPLIRIAERVARKNLPEGSIDIKAMENTLDYFYARRPKSNPAVIRKKLSKENQQLLEQLEDFIESEDKTITIGDTTYSKSDAVKKIKELTKGFSVSQALEYGMRYMHLKTMGYNLFSMTTNFGNAFFANLMHGYGGEDFKTSDIIEAYGLLMTHGVTPAASGAGATEIGKKIAEIFERNSIIDSTNDMYTSKKYATIKKRWGWLLPYGPTQFIEYINQGSTFIAMAKSQKVGDSDLWTKLMNEEDLGDFDLVEFIIKYRGVKGLVHGNYDELRKILATKTQVGRMLMMFRRWIGEGYRVRFQNTKYDNILRRNTEGRYVTAYDIITQDGTAEFFKQLYSAIRGESELTPNKIANLRKLFMEAIIIMSLLTFGALLKFAYDDEDDEEARAVFMAMINVSFKLQNELMFYVNPLSFQEIAKSNIPALSLTIDAAKFSKALVNYIVDPEEDEILTGKFAGDSRLRRATFKLFPGASAYSRIESVTTMEDSAGN